MNRIKLIRQASPKEASHAPKVRSSSIIAELFGEILVVARMIAVIIDKIIPSRARRAISRCLR